MTRALLEIATCILIGLLLGVLLICAVACYDVARVQGPDGLNAAGAATNRWRSGAGAGAVIAATGGGGAHNNLPPYQIRIWIIRVR